MAAAREENVYMAKLAEQAERYEEMVEFMEKVTTTVDAEELTVEERNLLSVAYKNVIGARRASWRIISSIEQKEESRGNEDHVNIIRDYRSKIETELSSICDGILRLLDTRLFPSATSGDSKVFYLKMKGDYHCYLAEFKTGAERKEAAESTLSAYKAAQDIAVAELSPTHPIRLGLSLNFSVFYYEILNSPDRACNLAKQVNHTKRELHNVFIKKLYRHPEFRYKTEFQSHEPEFDYLKSLEIEEKINKVRWCQSANGALFLLSTNDKTVKYWKVQEKKVKKVCDMNIDSSDTVANGRIDSQSGLASDFVFHPGRYTSLHLPLVIGHETNLVPRCRRVYAHAHDYHINSISNNSDGETFISADDLRINLWNLEICNQSFNIVDVKPVNMEDLTEVITSAEFHPTHCNTLAYSSSKGTVRLIDMRQSALCDSHAKIFEEHDTSGSRSFFTEIIASISDIKFGKDGRHILTRDYMTLKLWDLNMESSPIATFQVHEYLRPKLCDLYENDTIFDKFECCLSGDGTRVATGSYSNLFRIFGSTEAMTLEASKNPTRRQTQAPSKPSRSFANLARSRRRGAETVNMEANGGTHDFSTKLLHLAWHPTSNVIACAAANSLYMYYAENRPQSESK